MFKFKEYDFKMKQKMNKNTFYLNSIGKIVQSKLPLPDRVVKIYKFSAVSDRWLPWKHKHHICPGPSAGDSLTRSSEDQGGCH